MQWGTMNGVVSPMDFSWTVALPEFADDPALANEELLSAIYQEWFEEVNPI